MSICSSIPNTNNMINMMKISFSKEKSKTAQGKTINARQNKNPHNKYAFPCECPMSLSSLVSTVPPFVTCLWDPNTIKYGHY